MPECEYTRPTDSEIDASVDVVVESVGRVFDVDTTNLKPILREWIDGVLDGLPEIPVYTTVRDDLLNNGPAEDQAEADEFATWFYDHVFQKEVS